VADKLRKNIDAAEYKHIVLGLIFLKYISDAFEELYNKLQSGEGDYAGEPFLLFANFNYSMYQNSHLCQFIETWLGRKFASQEEADAFDIETLIRKPGFVSVIHSDDGKWVNINTIMPLPEGMSVPVAVGKVFVVDMDNIQPTIIEGLTEKLQAAIKNSHEWKAFEAKGSAPQPEYDERNPPPADFENGGDGLPF